MEVARFVSERFFQVGAHIAFGDLGVLTAIRFGRAVGGAFGITHPRSNWPHSAGK